MSINYFGRGNSISRITGQVKGSSAVAAPPSVPVTPRPGNAIDYTFPGTNTITFTGEISPLAEKRYIPSYESKYIGNTRENQVSILVVGGGGGTLAPISASPPGYGGGGGSGGVAYLVNGKINLGRNENPNKAYVATVGGGGPGSPSTDVANLPARLGANSSFVGDSFNVIGRGGGGGSIAGGPGGSGGGASWPDSTPVGQGTQPQQTQIAPVPVTNYGNPGGPTFPFTSFPSSYHNSSGGGGAGTPGLFPGGGGGNGVTLLDRSVGGGGGGRGSPNGSGGPGGGGTAGSSGGSTNTGGGGGGGNYAGGSGTIVVRVQF
jgi:hypothetical protein